MLFRFVRLLLTSHQKKYLAQVYNIGPDYAQGIYDLLAQSDSKPEFPFSEVEKLSESAHVWFKEEKFRPSNGERLTGYAPSMPVYN
jgi:catalase